MSPPLSAQDLGLITNVRTLTTDDATRVILHLSRPIPYQLTTEPPSSDQRSDPTPSSLLLLFHRRPLLLAFPRPFGLVMSLLTSVRSGQMSTATVRISLELTGIGTYRAIDLRSPYQVVIVLRKASPRPRQELETQRQERRPPRQESERPPQNRSPHNGLRSHRTLCFLCPLFLQGPTRRRIYRNPLRRLHL